MRTRVAYVIRATDHTLATHTVIDPTIHTSRESSTQTLSVCWVHCLASRTKKGCTHVIPRAITLEKHSLNITPLVEGDV